MKHLISVLGCLSLFWYVGLSAAGTLEELEATTRVKNLEGTYLNTGEGHPTVLILPGSGAVDRDGNQPKMNSNAYKHLARQLAEHNISSVRVDKRGLSGSHAAGDPNAVTVELYAEDYGHWVDHIKALTGQPCVYLMGHSEGGIMASATAMGREGICGLILLASPGRTLDVILREQLEKNPANKPLLEQAFYIINELKHERRVADADIHWALKPLFRSAVQGYHINLMKVDPAGLAAKAKVPILIIQGDNDLQVTMEDAKRLQEKTKGQLVIVEGMNHVLKRASRNRFRNLRVYNNSKRPVHPELIEAVVGFVK